MDPLTLQIPLPNRGIIAIPLARAPQRLVAAIIDTALQLFCVSAPPAALSLMPQLLEKWPHLPALSRFLEGLGPHFHWDGALASFTLLWSFLSYWLFNLYFELAWQGQSPGKRLMGLRVVGEDLSPITFTQVFLRTLLRPLDTWGFFMVGALSAFFTPLQQRLGDLAAGTLVIEESYRRGQG